MTKVALNPRRSEQALNLFSGGNQQKVILAKWLRARPLVLLLDEPTQGVDVGAQTAIHELVRSAARDQAAVLVCSSDAKELVTLCDRVLVIEGGSIVAEIRHDELTHARLVREELRSHGASERVATDGPHDGALSPEFARQARTAASA